MKLSRRAFTKVLAAAGLVSILWQPQAQSQGSDPVVVIQTTKGPITMRIFYSMVPYTASNFLNLVEQGFYNGLSFHRVENWVVQGGDPNGNGTGVYVDPATGRPNYLKLETNRNLTQRVGAVCMARGKDYNSASCQFYILKNAMPGLNGQYAVFGQVLEGMNSVYAMQRGDRIISAAVTGGGGGSSASSSGTSEPQGYQGGPAPRPVDSGF